MSDAINPSGKSGWSGKTITWHGLDGTEVVRLLESSDEGLSTGEAGRRLAKLGPNALPEAGKRPVWLVFFKQFASPLIYILLAAAGFAFFVGERRDAGVILAVVILNSVIGAFQEGRAERSMESLRRLAELQARILRDGREILVSARQLVPGDLLVLAAGDAVGADARLLDCAALEASEAALTGESLPVPKTADRLPEGTPVSDRCNMVYSGTHVAAGRGRAVVVATGLHTEVGKIASLMESTVEPKTPLETRIKQFGRWLTVAAVLLFLAIMGFGLLRELPFNQILMVSISQMVSVVPEGLPVAMTIALAVGMQRMATRRALVRKLAAVETLGCTTVICTDKTGTLTRNEMTVTTIRLPDGRTIEVGGVGYAPEGVLSENGREISTQDDAGLRALLEAAVLCNDARLVPPDATDSRWRPMGDPTEAALLALSLKAGQDHEALRRDHPRRDEIPFDSGSKMMATRHGHGPDARIRIKGAPEMVLRVCGSVRANGHDAPLDAPALDRIAQASAEMAGRTLRLLAFAELADYPADQPLDFAGFGNRAVFLGLVGQMDPPRDEVQPAIAACRKAGIRPIMVTGDHKETGIAVARGLGIIQGDERALDGGELEAMREQDLRHDLDQISVFARVHPAQKLRIVEALQARGHVVAMTGDGVNDAPALARADVGVAMGITGTEVAKGAADIVVADDNFATIVGAVEQGRLVFGNLKKVILFLFTTSIDEVVILLAALVMDLPLPLVAVQILWINVVTESVLTVNLVMEEPEGDELERQPVPRDEPLITRTMLGRMVSMAASAVVATFGYFLWRHHSGDPLPQIRSETFTLLVVCQWFNALNCRSSHQSVFHMNLFRNRWLLGGLLLGNLLQVLVIYTPGLNRVFHTVPIPLADFFIIGAVASIVLWVEEARKLVVRHLAHRHAGRKSHG